MHFYKFAFSIFMVCVTACSKGRLLLLVETFLCVQCTLSLVFACVDVFACLILSHEHMTPFCADQCIVLLLGSAPTYSLTRGSGLQNGLPLEEIFGQLVWSFRFCVNVSDTDARLSAHLRI